VRADVTVQLIKSKCNIAEKGNLSGVSYEKRAQKTYLSMHRSLRPFYENWTVRSSIWKRHDDALLDRLES
jgi:hypothetical protein